MQGVSSWILLRQRHSDTRNLSAGQLLRPVNSLQQRVLVSERHIWGVDGTGIGERLHIMHARLLLRVSGLDSADGSMQVGIFLRRRQLGVYTSLQQQ